MSEYLPSKVAELQELINRSVAHIRKQGEPSANVNTVHPDATQCQYRGINGLSCGAAMFIVNYTPKMENKTFNDLVNDFPNDLEETARIHGYFVWDVLQRAHDKAAHQTLVSKLTTRTFAEAYEVEIRARIEEWNRKNKTELVVP